MNSIEIKGTVEVLGKQVPKVFGGFGEDQKVILAREVAVLHDVPIGNVNRNINNHIEDGYFEEGIDFIDLKNDENLAMHLVQSEIFTRNAINAAHNIYLLSQQGYSLLLKLMNTPKAREQYKEVIRDYFELKFEVQEKHEEEQNKALTDYLNLNENQRAMLYFQQREQLMISEVKIKEDAPKVEQFLKFLDVNDAISFEELSKMLNIPKMGRNKLFKYLREKNILMSGVYTKNRPYETYKHLFKVVQVYSRAKQALMDKTLIKPTGIDKIYKILKDDGYIINKSVEDIKMLANSNKYEVKQLCQV